jgi:DNA-directed RNA polymerase specialized sigma24 family protein
MTPAEVGHLVARMQRSDPSAFTELVVATIGDLRLLIATYVPTIALGEALVREVYAAARCEISRCPATEEATAWLNRTAMTLVETRLGDAVRGAAAARDPLAHIVAQAGVEALTLNPNADNDAASELPRRLNQQPPSLRQLLQRHYAEGLTVATIAERQGLVEGEVAQALLSARSRMDWTSIAEVGDAADRTFPSVVEDYLAGTLVPDTRALLVASVMQDPVRATQFERQVRLHLLLQVLFTPVSREQVVDLVQSLPDTRNESSRLLVPPPRPLSTRTMLARPPTTRSETHRTRRQVTETRAGGRPTTRTQVSGSHAAVAEDDAGDEPLPPPPNRLPLIIAAALAMVGFIGLVVVWMRPPQGAATTAAPVAAVGERVPAGDPSFGLIHNSEGSGTVLRQGKRLPIAVGDALAIGDGLETGASAVIGVLVADQVRLTLSADGAVPALGLADEVVEVMVTQGRLAADLRRGPRVRSIRVQTPQGSVLLGDATAVVEVGQGITRLQVSRGTARLARNDGGAGVDVAAGAVAVSREGSDPTLDGGGVFVRGINFGEGPVTIDRNPWLSLAEARGSGMTLGAGTRLGSPALISGVGLDFDSKRMLDVGLVGEGGQVELRQQLPNGDYDLSLWIASSGGTAWDRLGVVAGGKPLAAGPPATKAERWRRMGPYRIQVRDRTLALRLSGLTGLHLAGMALHASGPLDGSLPPMVLITDPTSQSSAAAMDLVIRTRTDAPGGIAKVVFFNGDTVLGEATRPPFSFTWVKPPIGAFALSAVVTDSAGASSRSPVVAGTLVDPASIPGLLREVWRGIHVPVKELRQSPTYRRTPNEVRTVADPTFVPGGDGLAVRMRAWLTPPLDGEYVFLSSSDDDSEVWLSSDDQPANRRLICEQPEFSDPGQWEKFPTQRSAPIRLVAGKRVFIELLLKQGGGGIHLNLGWIRPDGKDERPIPSDRFAPFPSTPDLPPPGEAIAPPVVVQPGTPSPATTAPPPVRPVALPPLPAGPLLSGSCSAPGQLVNLSELGSADWIHYGLVDATSVTRRRGADLLTVVRTADNAQILRYDNNSVRFAWGDGAPVAEVAATTTGWFTANLGKGFVCSAPASPALRRVMVWVGGHDTDGVFTASLGDGSAPAYRDTSVKVGNGNGWMVYTLWYRSKNPGQTLNLGYSSSRNTGGNITFQAIALAEFGDGAAEFIRGVNLQGDDTVIEGRRWVGQKQAEAEGLVVRGARKVTISVEPKPAVDAGMKEMLTSGVAAKSGEDLVIQQKLPNGRYEVVLYTLENAVANSRLFDITVGDQQLSGIGQLPQHGWGRFGPLPVTVANGLLNITAKSRKGSAQLMGFAVTTPGETAAGPRTNAFPGGRAHPVPGVIRAVDFDLGVEGEAFHDLDPKNEGGVYRDGPVDIDSSNQKSLVAWIRPDEWLRYTIAASEAGAYTVRLRYGRNADPVNARIVVELDGVPSAPVALRDTGGWGNLATIDLAVPITMSAGQHDVVVRFLADRDHVCNFASIEFIR